MNKPFLKTASAAAALAFVIFAYKLSVKTNSVEGKPAITPAEHPITDRGLGLRPFEAAENFLPDEIEYREENGSAAVKVAMDEVALIDADGYSKIVKIDPPATPSTLGARLVEFSAAQGVLPVAYAESKSRSEENRRYVTSQIRVKMPQDEAERLAKRHGLEIVDRPSYAPEWVVFSASQPVEALKRIEGIRGESSVEVADVLLATQMSKKILPNDPLVATQWHIKSSGAALAGTDVNIESTWQYGTAGNERRGEGIVIGIVDDGLQTAHPDLAANVNTAIDIDYNGNDNDPNPGPFDSHGTACGGLAGARGGNGIGITGTAPAATLVGMRLIAGPVTDATIASAMNHQNVTIQVKSNSWGPGDSGEGLNAPGDLTQNALRNGTINGREGRGTIYLFAGGNGGRSDTQDNSNYDGFANSIYTVAIGATDSRGRRADYAEPGANLVVSAPSSGSGGLGIVTTDNTGASGYNSATSAAGGDYTNTFGGTSAATPEVAGIVALMLKANPALGWRDVQEILIRSAKKILPGDADWRDNSAGFHFNHNFGAGLVDATAAVTMATTWQNLGDHINAVSTQGGLNATIPNNNAAGLTRQFSIPTSNIRSEHVTLRLSINHQSRGELEISLTSPSGMVSRLAEVRGDRNSNYSNWTFSSTRHWGELSSGTWTLKVADRSSSNSNSGRLTFAELTVYGASAAPVNPAPVVTILSPATGSLSSPGAQIPVTVSAEDFDVNGDPSTVSKVELFANGALVGTLQSPPYSFVHDPQLGDVTFVAKATDIEGEVAESAAVVVTVVDQTPEITAVAQSESGQMFSDRELRVNSVTAIDPENDPVTLAYQWQFSVNETDFTNSSGATSPALPVAPSNAGKIWRCRITATDGKTTSAPTFTSPVNILSRPLAFAKPGDAYSYQSGLVLKGFETVITRQAIIHEFSHGNNGTNAQWAEILTMKTGSFRNWQFRDAIGNNVIFRNSAVWDAIPAGTLIVIYNNKSPKNTLLPPDNFDPSTGIMVISSGNSTYFDTGISNWPSFGSSGGSLFLTDGSGTIVHDLSYGSSTDASPNIGIVRAERAAFYFGDSDAGADSARNWLNTGSSVQRFEGLGKADVVAKDLPPFAVMSGGRYSQDFDSTPGQFGTSYPDGWSAYNNQTFQSVVQVETMSVGNGSELTTGNFNYGSKVGFRGTTRTFDPGFVAIGLRDTAGLTGLKVSYDIVKVDEKPVSVEFVLEYTDRNPRNSSTSWTPVSGGSYVSGNSPSGTVTRFENIALPSVFNNRTIANSPRGEPQIYLRWRYQTSPTNTGAGTLDALAIDNVLISSAQSPNILLGLTLTPSTVSEASGTAASIAKLTISEAPATDRTFQIVTSDTALTTVPASVVIPAGQTSVNFPIGVINNEIPNGTRPVTISISGPGFVTVSKVLTVTDDEAPVDGVTPGLANSGPNELFVNRLRTNKLIDPPLYSLASGSILPPGLSLNGDTGIISGTISQSAALGVYTVTVNLTNITGDITSQTFNLNLSATGAPTFESWIAGFAVADAGINGDSDLDQIPNLIEYKLNSLPGVFDRPSPILLERSATGISITYTRVENRDDVSLVAEWNTSLGASGWQTAGITETITGNFTDSQTIKSFLPIVTGDPKRFIRLRAIKVASP